MGPREDIQAARERFDKLSEEYTPTLRATEQGPQLNPVGIRARNYLADRLTHHKNPQQLQILRRAEAQFRIECENLLPILEQAGVEIPGVGDAAGRVLQWAIGDAGNQPPLPAGWTVARKLESLLRAMPDASGKSTAKRKRSTKPREVTANELAAMQAVAEHKGNKSQAAKSLGKDWSTVDDAYRRGMKKLGKTISKKKPRTQQFPRDRRGGESTATGDDRRAD